MAVEGGILNKVSPDFFSTEKYTFNAVIFKIYVFCDWQYNGYFGDNKTDELAIRMTKSNPQEQWQRSS